jgi:hypothetical protein
VGRATVPLLETALEQARELASDPVAKGLMPYFERHIAEESHGDEPGEDTLDDLAALGVDPVVLRASLPAPKVAALIGAQYYWVLRHHPVAVLGFLELEAYHPDRSTVELLIERTGLPRDGFRQLLLHAELDVGHADELHDVLDSLPLDLRHEQLIGVSALQTFSLLAEALLDVVEEKVSPPWARTGPAAPVGPAA